MALLNGMFVEKTRLGLVVFTMGLALIEGLIKVLLNGFPLTEVFSIQALVVGGYISVKTINNMSEVKYANNKGTINGQVAVSSNQSSHPTVDNLSTKGL